jgi:hypothetical protein
MDSAPAPAGPERVWPIGRVSLVVPVLSLALLIVASGLIATRRALSAMPPARDGRTAATGARAKKPPAKRTSFLLGLNAGYGGPHEISDLRRVASIVRLQDPTRPRRWESAGLKVIADEVGPYTSSGVSGLDHRAYVRRVIALVTRNPHLFAVEVLNEPGGSWFWGPQSESDANRRSYAQLLIEVHNALVARFDGARPLELASWDGGHDSSNAWGEAWSKNSTALADVDAVTNHPYGGTDPRSQAILGDRALVAADEARSHKPIYITEVGFPTGAATSDSLQYTEAEQASAIYRFGLWAKRTSYVAGVTFFTYRDKQGEAGYGVETRSGAKKQSFAALERLHGDL